MRISGILLSTCLAVGGTTGSLYDILGGLGRRQDNDNDLPTIGGGAGLPTGSTSTSASASESVSQTATESITPSSTESGSASESATASNSRSASGRVSTSVQTATTETTAPTSEPTPTQLSDDTNGPEGLPITPRITPALAFGGVILLLTGIAYGLIGVKNRWVHVSLSSAYLTSLSVTVLIVYVMNPPVSNAIQGAYFVGIFMTGVIFGAGALIFKEVTEGLGCLLGGFCLAMWFLTLKDGGLITSTTGKAIFISVFCVLAWATSFNHITRPYGLIASTSFSGATSFILGVDCFSRGGLKEFWLWIWDLNPNVFPLNTPTYPITRGTRVETIIIILACLIGVMSQLKLWKVVRDRQQKRAAEQQDESRRQDAVEAALGRHLERRNDRDKSEWERQYGNLLQAKRETVLWTDTHREKKTYSRISETEMGDGSFSPSVESLEMGSVPQRPRSVYVARVKRQSSAPVDTITEVDETDITGSHPNSRMQRSRSSDMLQRESQVSVRNSVHAPGPQSSRENLREHLHTTQTGEADVSRKEQDGSPYGPEPKEYRTLKVGSRASFRSPEPEEYMTPRGISRASLTAPDGQSNPRHSTGSKRLTSSSVQDEFVDAVAEGEHDVEKTQVIREQASQHLTAPDKQARKRKSWSSILSKTSAKEKEDLEHANASQEALIVPPAILGHSRASSLAATLDSENEILDLNVDTNMSHVKAPPNIVVSPVRPPDSGVELGSRKTLNVTPPPPALEEEEEFEADPEELVRPMVEVQPEGQESKRQSSSGHESSKRRSGLESEVGTEILFEEGARSHAGTTNTSMSDILTKGALERLPSQLSNIVLSYRTNEWAKHASSAEAPLYEEPESPTEETIEVPAHLLSAEELQKQVEITEPPPLSRPLTAMSMQSPVEVATPNPNDGIKANPTAQNIAPVSANTQSTSVQPQVPVHRARVNTELNRNNSATRGLRSSSTPMLVPNLANATIDENTAVDFAPQTFNRSTSVMSFNRLSGDSSTFVPQQNAYYHAGTHPYGGAFANNAGVTRSTSRLSHASEMPNMPMRTTSQTSLHQPRGLLNGRSETRMASYDSHQPQRRNTDLETQRREAMFADWRMSQQKSRSPTDYSEAHHAQRIFEKMQAKHTEEYEKNIKAQQDMQIDVAMRGRDMQEAHREAMRRMQAGVNKKL